MKNFFISDLHFWHTNILKFDSRPWDTVEEMNQALIDNWNSVVTDEDRVYMLGDFCWKPGKTKEILEQLNGNIIWIIGNHDEEKESYYRKLVTLGYIEEYHNLLVRWIDGYEITLCHYPIICYKHDSDDRNLMFYGHVHRYTSEAELVLNTIKYIKKSRTELNHNRGQMINVGCMLPYMDYTPQTTEYLVSVMDKEEHLNV